MQTIFLYINAVKLRDEYFITFAVVARLMF